MIGLNPKSPHIGVEGVKAAVGLLVLMMVAGITYQMARNSTEPSVKAEPVSFNQEQAGPCQDQRWPRTRDNYGALWRCRPDAELLLLEPGWVWCRCRAEKESR